jgi:hypothetical protein
MDAMAYCTYDWCGSGNDDIEGNVMKKWIDDHMGWIMTLGLILVLILIAWYISISICMDCPPVNVTSKDLIV